MSSTSRPSRTRSRATRTLRTTPARTSKDGRTGQARTAFLVGAAESAPQSVVAFDGGLELGRALEPVTLAEPFERGLERVLIGHVRRDPAVAADVARDPHIREQVRDLALLQGQLDRHVDGSVAGDRPAEDLVLADLEDGEVAPGPVLVRLWERERQLGDPPLDRRHSHVRILAVSGRSRRGSRIRLTKDKGRTSMAKQISELMTANPCAIEADKPV